MLPERADGAGPGAAVHASWPWTLPTYWCGEHPLRQRDRLAAMAMQGILADGTTMFTNESLARSAYEVADAMLAERSKPTPTQEPTP